MKKKLKLSVLVLCVIVMLAGCGGNGNGSEDNLNTDAKQEGQVKTYTVSVNGDDGLALADVDISIYSDANLEELIATGVTNSNGVAAFTLNESDNYVVTLSGVSDNYATDEAFQFEGSTADIILAYQPRQQVNPDDKVVVKDKIYNYVFENANGDEFLLYDLLSEKKIVILEFTMGLNAFDHDRIEISFMESIYQLYKDDIEIVAIPCYGWPCELSEVYLSGYNNSIAHALDIVGYPTTVYISSDGIIRNIIAGRMDKEEYINIIDELISE